MWLIRWGLPLPDPVSDVFDCLDAFPEDDFGFVGGDGEIRFLDWQVILRRSLRLPPYYAGTNNWQRAWSFAGDRTNAGFVLPPASDGTHYSLNSLSAPWNRQALVGAGSVGFATAGQTVSVPIFVRVANGASVSGMQFRAMVTADNGGPGISATPVFVSAAGVNAPVQSSFIVNEVACGWSLGSFSFGSRTSNYLGVLRFTIPNVAQGGQGYTVSFANVDGAPDLYTQYDFESKRSAVVVGDRKSTSLN